MNGLKFINISLVDKIPRIAELVRLQSLIL